MFYDYVELLVSRGNELNLIEATTRYNGTDEKRLSTGFPQSYKDLEVKVGFGKGVWAKIPWISFLAKGQKVSNGIYPVLLHYRENNLLILAYGVSADNPPSTTWATASLKSIGKYFREKKIKAYNKYNKSYVYKVYQADTIDTIKSTINDDIDELIKYYKSILSSKTSTVTSATSMISPAPAPTSSPMDYRSGKDLVSAVIDSINSSGLIYSEHFISRFVISLMTKPFVILSGLAGSGKTQLAIAFAKAISTDIQKQVRIVPVGADWTNREPLLGYPNALNEGTYVHPDSNVLQLILDAEQDPDQPYFLILDEMNLSYVERYFSDFLSALESKSAIPLWKNTKKSDSDENIPEEITLPSNLFIIGTINVDETTYMFSPKVLDRASVIEFKINSEDLKQYLEEAPDVNIDRINNSLVPYAKSFVDLSRKKVPTGLAESMDTLLAFFKELKAVNAEFGYRSAYEIGRFIALAINHGHMKSEESIDAAIVQKLLPKLHGSRKKLVPIITKLWDMCETGIKIEQSEGVPEQTKYPLTADKLLRMYRGAIDNGFTSFAEA